MATIIVNTVVISSASTRQAYSTDNRPAEQLTHAAHRRVIQNLSRQTLLTTHAPWHWVIPATVFLALPTNITVYFA